MNPLAHAHTTPALHVPQGVLDDLAMVETRLAAEIHAREPRLTEIATHLVGAGGKLVSGVFLATYVVAQRPSLGQVQIHQNRLDRVVYKLRPGPAFDPLIDGLYLENATREYLGEGISAEIEIVEDFPRSASGKFLFSRSTVSPKWLSPQTA